MNRLLIVLKRFFVGRPVSSHAELHHRLPKRIALAVFSSDALSSSAYATDEILLALVVAGYSALALSIPIAITVAVVLAIVVISYRQTVRAYPQGGGAYRVAHDNLGKSPGLIAASSLLIDYVLTVSVSSAAGIVAIVAAFPELRSHTLAMTLGAVAFIMLMNLRGLKESGTLFAVPTYGFLVSMMLMIAIGLFRVLTGSHNPLPTPHAVTDAQPLTMFLILLAFARGSTALTGIEAISDGVPAFRRPESKNAAQTLLILGILLAILFIGLTFLANAYQVDPHLIETEKKSVPSQVAAAVFGPSSPFFYVIQVFTALILLLAANTAYADFPRLSSILARDRYLPRVFQNRGDKLAFSNGIVLLSLASAGVLIAFNADLHKIISLYVIGVFTSFTLSQAGMVVRWFRLKDPGWRRSATVNAVGAVTTFLVLIIQSFTKFLQGAWLVMVLIPLLALLLWRINAHYGRVRRILDLQTGSKLPRIDENRVLVLVSPFIGATVKAITFARALNPSEVHLVAFRIPERLLRRVRSRLKELGIQVPIEGTGHKIPDLEDFVRGLGPTVTHPVTLIIPDPQSRNPISQVFKGFPLLRIKGAMLDEANVIVASVPFRPEVDPEPEKIRDPSRVSIIVVVAAVHRATFRAIDYAKSLNPSDLKALTISLDSQESSQLVSDWNRADLDVPLEVIDSPYRSVTQPLLQAVRELRPNPNDVVGVVIPEFIVGKWWQHLLHGQTALLMKTALLFEPNVVVIDVPFPIDPQPPNKDKPSIEETEVPVSRP